MNPYISDMLKSRILSIVLICLSESLQRFLLAQTLKKISYKQNLVSVLAFALFFLSDRRSTILLKVEFVLAIVQSVSCLFTTPWTAAHQAPLSSNISRSLLKFMYTELVILSNHLIRCFSLHLQPSIFPNIKAFSNKSALCIRGPKYCSFNFSISPSNQYSGLINVFIYFNWSLITLQFCIGFAIHQHEFSLELTGLISLKSKGLSRVFSNTIQNHQFFGIQSSSWSYSHSID